MLASQAESREFEPRIPLQVQDNLPCFSPPRFACAEVRKGGVFHFTDAPAYVLLRGHCSLISASAAVRVGDTPFPGITCGKDSREGIFASKESAREVSLALQGFLGKYGTIIELSEGLDE